jgi:hypothetical protein
MAEQAISAQIPSFLTDYGTFYSHIQSQLEELKPQEKGKVFAEFVQGLVRHTEIGKYFESPKLRQPTHDEGVDLECQSLDGSQSLYIQAKYTIRGVDDLAEIFDKFKSFEDERKKDDTNLTVNRQLVFDEVRVDKNGKRSGGKISHYMVFTASKLLETEKMSKYEESKRTSVNFYKNLKSEERIHIYDGCKILPIARTAYIKQHIIPSNIDLPLVNPFIRMENVYIGVIAGSQLKALYNDFGDSLFLQNLREWLGPNTGNVPMAGRETVNQAIARTLKEAPDKFLARNNGITFRASSILEKDEKTLKLEEASIVNGCQTTMSIVNNGNVQEDCHVLVKIVETPDAWDIAGAANFQTKVDRIDLDIARYIRPQAIAAAAVQFGIRLKKPSNIPASVFAVFDSIARTEIIEDEIRALFIGLFSRTPNNAIEINYADLRTDVLQEYGSDSNKDNVLYMLFVINENTCKSAEKVKEAYQKAAERMSKKQGREKTVTISDLFQRFWNDNVKKAPNYRAFLTILAACGCAGENIYGNHNEITYQNILDFLKKVATIIENEPEVFVRYYRKAFMSLAVKLIDPDSGIDKILQMMHANIKSAKFDNLYLILDTLDIPD